MTPSSRIPQNSNRRPRETPTTASGASPRFRADASHLQPPVSQWPLSQLSLSADTCLPFPLVSPSHLPLCGVELFGVFFRFFSEVCLRGEGIPRCFRPPLVFQLITANMTALLLFGAEPSRLSCPRGESKSSASLPLSPS